MLYCVINSSQCHSCTFTLPNIPLITIRIHILLDVSADTKNRPLKGIIIVSSLNRCKRLSLHLMLIHPQGPNPCWIPWLPRFFYQGWMLCPLKVSHPCLTFLSRYNHLIPWNLLLLSPNKLICDGQDGCQGVLRDCCALHYESKLTLKCPFHDLHSPLVGEGSTTPSF